MVEKIIIKFKHHQFRITIHKKANLNLEISFDRSCEDVASYKLLKFRSFARQAYC